VNCATSTVVHVEENFLGLNCANPEILRAIIGPVETKETYLASLFQKTDMENSFALFAG
jgi:hypothetical protein